MEDEDDSKKEICTIYTMLKNNSHKKQMNQLMVTVTCYQYGIWTITRGPTLITNFLNYISQFNLKFYQKTGSNVVVILGF